MVRRALLLILFSLGLSLPLQAAGNPFEVDVENTTLLNPACPVTFTGIYAGEQRSGGAAVSVHFVNAGEKRLIAVKLGLTGFDATRDPHDFPQPYALAVNLKPQREARPLWHVSDADFEVDTASGARVYVMKALYANGATWEDDGARSCALTIRGIAKKRTEEDR